MGSLTSHELLERAAQARRDNRLSDSYRDSNEAMIVARKEGSRNDVIRALRMLGQIERDEGRPECALQHYQEAVALCRTEGGALRLAHAIRHLGDLLVEMHNLAEAAKEYTAALALYRQQPDTKALDLANTLRAIAVMRQQAGDSHAARPFWEEARTLYSSANVEQGVAECNSHLADSIREGL
jgi:tetratricopeptide (TPR) repeat protein